MFDLEDFRHDDFVEDSLLDLDREGVPYPVSLDDDSSLSTADSIDSTDDCTLRSLRTVDVPAFSTVLPTVDLSSTPTVLQALHKLTSTVRECKIRVIEYYARLRSVSPLLSATCAPRAHVDGGSIATTTDRKEYLFSYHEFSATERERTVRLKVADDTVHVPTGTGFLKIPCHQSPGFLFVKSYYTPQIPATILSPDSVARSLDCNGYTTFSNLVDDTATMQLVDCSSCGGSLDFSLQSIRGLLFTDSLYAPTYPERTSLELPVDAPAMVASQLAPSVVPPSSTVSVRTLSGDQQRALWHCRLGHTNARAVADLHKYVDGIPKLPRDDPISSCPLCKKAKLHKADRGPLEEIVPTSCWQDIQIDLGFMVQSSSSTSNKNKRATAVSQKKQPPLNGDSDPPTPSSLGPTSNKARRRVAELRQNDVAPRRSTRSTRFAGSFKDSPSKDMSSNPIPSPTGTGEGTTKRSQTPAATMSPYTPPPSNETWDVEKILAHQGPLARNDKRYRGDVFNLKVRWSTQETTWEPLNTFFEDQPEMVVEYARQHNLLGNPHWSNVRDLSLDPDYNKPFENDPHEEHDFVPDKTVPTAESLETQPKRYRRALGIYGETCYVLISCRKSGAIKASIRRDKSPAIDFFKHFLANFKPDVPHCRVRFDGGGELGGNEEIHRLFNAAGYTVEVTAPDTSSSIGAVERPHRTIASAVRTMLYSAGLGLQYWPFALQHYVLIHNALPHGPRSDSAYTICTGKRFNVSRLRVFGCRIYALPSHKRDAKLDVHSRSGIFLGYRHSMSNAIYVDSQTGLIKQARHVAFDEGMTDSVNPPPFVAYLNNPDSKLELADLAESDTLDVSLSPFGRLRDIECSFRPQDKYPLGIHFTRCPRYFRAYASDFLRPFGPHDVSAARRHFLGGYITKIGTHSVFTLDDISRVLHDYAHQATPPTHLTVRISSDLRSALSDQRQPSLSLRPVDIRRIAALNLVAGEGTSISLRHQLRDVAATPLLAATPADPDDLIPHSAADLLEMRKLSNDHMTEEEKALPAFTRHRLMKLSNWADWQAADDKQLDQHYDAGTIGKAVPRPTKDPDKPSQVFRLHWARLVKATGVRKSRACLDGSKRAAPWLRMMVQTYSSCVELPCLRAFVAMCAIRGYYVCFGDVENAYQQSPPPTIDCYLEIDDTIYDWYYRRFGIKLDRKTQVIPLRRALQGHPEAGVLWERMITDILVNKMGFRNTTHEKNLYIGTIDGDEVLICRQVDDFAAGAASIATAKKFITVLRKHVEAECAGMGIEMPEGYYQRYNGIDFHQTRDYIKLSAESYIDRMLQTHGWDSPKQSAVPTTDVTKAVPLNPAIANKLMTLEGPPEKSIEAMAISKANGFSYRNVLGELIYAYVICRVDIGYAVCFLARFSERPHDEHYKALKSVCKYLRATKDWGIMYQRVSPLENLPSVPFDWLQPDPSLPAFPQFARDELIGFLDAAHATELKSRRSVTGYLVLFCCAAIAWKSRVQSVVATSSTEAEFYAAVSCAKVVKYLRYVLGELQALRDGATRLLVDNQAAIAMINESRPTPRARHIDIQHFAIQEWRAQGDIIMEHCPGVLNASDDLTKPLGWALHSRHARRGMGHYRIGSALDSESSVRPPMLDQRPSEPGRVLEPNPQPTKEQPNADAGRESNQSRVDDVASSREYNDPRGNSPKRDLT